MEKTYEIFGINEKIVKLAKTCDIELKERFEQLEDICMYNQAKVLKAFHEFRISQMHFTKTTGYGYDDIGRDTIEKVYAKIFNTQDSLVRIQFVNGTHTIATVLQALLNQNDELLAISGTPYDTLCEVIGIKENKMSLINNGVKYSQINLLDNGDFDLDKITQHIKDNKVKLIHIQRSKGYELRKSLYVSDIKNVVQCIKKLDENILIMVDNCYGEFVEEFEPTDVGVDILCGSLIKNIGGGLCETGGYIAGRHDLIELCAQKLTCPGIGRECGATLGQNRNILQGLFMAPSTVMNALKSAVFASCILTKLGYEAYPKALEKRSDIVQAIKLNNKEQLIKFIQGIQSASPVDSHVTPYPWEMPGYDDEVIMAAGTFIQGASIELSADSPIREPFVAYMQGGLTYESAKIATLIAIQKMIGDVI
ncbi:MAG: methionine gamma-lyase family protein [Clostridia bacterium]